MTSTKHKLLQCLKQTPRQWVSGQQISNQLGITRAAIWKHIRYLKDEGHIIESAPRKGYRLEKAADLMADHDIQACLHTQVIGRPELICLSQTDSTNLQAKNLAARGAPEGTVVVAEAQTNGRGRRGRTWFSPAGKSIYASIVLRPSMAPAQAPQITLMTAVAVAHALQDTTGLKVEIKWPNDILIAHKKVAGILTEISTEMDAIDYVVVGLGLNVNITDADMPSDIQSIATSVQMQIGRQFPRSQLLCKILQHFESSYETLKQDGFKPIIDQWRLMSDIIGQQVYVDMLAFGYTGIVENVDDDGVLILKDRNGQRHRIFSGDVTRIRKT
jgi:BirA family biotin operon repressor/biotin-[acetyl-CoA-carboxylase] ligase